MNVLFIIAPVDFKDEEYFVPKEVLEKNGIEVVTVSTVRKAKSVGGKTVDVDMLLNDATNKYDGIILIGGGGAVVYFEDPKVHTLSKEFLDNDKIVAAICIAPVTLAKAGILNGEKATVWSSIVDKRPIKLIEENKAIYIDGDVVADGKIITANGPAAAEKFGIKILEVLGK